MNDSRSDLRNRLLAERSALDKNQLDRAAEGLREQLDSILRNRAASTLAAYCAYSGELDPEAALRDLHQASWKVVLPVIGPDFTMAFAPWTPDVTRFVRNRFGIGEPVEVPVDAGSIDVVLVPGVAFDDHGSRLGHGAGYYDRFFAERSEHGHRPLRVGIAHDLQVVDELPIEPWDVPMDIVATPTRIIFTNPQPIDEP